MKVFVKPSGMEVKVNQNSEAHALSLGWKPKESESPAADEQVEPRQKRKYTRKDS